MPLDYTQLNREALTRLRDQTEEFLRDEMLRVAGSGPSRHAQTYYLSYNQSEPPPAKLELMRHNNNGAGTAVCAFFVGINNPDDFHEFRKRTWRRRRNILIPGISIGEPVAPQDGLIFTPQLSGCTFCFEVWGNELRAAHIQPTGMTGEQLERLIQRHGTLGSGRRPITYGANTYQNADRVNIIGVWRQQQWHLYGQIRRGSTGVEKVDYIYPGR